MPVFAVGNLLGSEYGVISIVFSVRVYVTQNLTQWLAISGRNACS